MAGRRADSGADSGAGTAAGQAATETLTFSHALHNAQGIACSDCHTDVASLDALSRRLLPKEAICLDCHDREPDGCTMCHTNLDARAAMSARAPQRDAEWQRALSFSHSKHLARVSAMLAQQAAPGAALGAAATANATTDPAAVCETCHGNVRGAEALPLTKVSMDACLGCHNHRASYDAGSCLGCHPSMQSKPLKAVAEFEHVGDWQAAHGQAARAQGAACMQCHTQSMCTMCHSAVAPAMPTLLFPERITEASIHRGDFLSTHPTDARFEADTCVRCHATSECRDCHATAGVAYGGASTTYTRHPPGYATPGGGDAFHGIDARANIVACAACHDQGAASICVNCHAVGKGGGSPHPPGWGDRHERDDASDDARCAACHS